MNTDQEVAAARLRNAYGTGPIPPLRDWVAPQDIDAAYSVQSINTAFWIGEGRRVIGRKIGLTAPSVQRQLGVSQPDYGVLFDDMQVANGAILPATRLLQAKVEGEVAFVMARDLANPRASVTDVIAATAYALPALEIVDSRIQDWKITIADTVADNASAGYFVLGTQPRSLSGLDLETCGMVLTLDDAVVSIGVGVACFGHPLNAAAWLARTLAARGETLRAGDIVMSGALGPMVPLTAGRVRVSIGGLGSAEFSCT